MNEKLEKISKHLQKQIGCHGYEHTERVIETCKVLGDALKADMEVLIPAAILHDIGRGNDDHAHHSAKMAKEILSDLGSSKIEAIVHAIDVHSFSAGGEANTLEARILSDADKLDAMGAFGIYRAAQYGIEHERPQEEFIQHFHEKLLKLKDLLYTEEAKRFAEQRHAFMLRYLEQIDRESKGLS